jgi:hypothetical protein
MQVSDCLLHFLSHTLFFFRYFLIVTAKNKNFNIYNTVFVLLLLALNSVFSALLGLNVSKETITDSYIISQDYIKAEAAMAQFPVVDNKSAVNLKIDEILSISSGISGYNIKT